MRLQGRSSTELIGVNHNMIMGREEKERMTGHVSPLRGGQTHMLA